MSSTAAPLLLLISALALFTAGPSSAYLLGDCDEVQEILPPAPQNNAQFGQDMDTSPGLLAISEYLFDTSAGMDAGRVHVYAQVGGAWMLEATLERAVAAARDKFGLAIALSGETLIVGSESGATIFERAGGTWLVQAELAAPVPDDGFGHSVAIDGDVALVGAEYDSELGTWVGAAYAYRRVAGVWTLEQKLLPLSPQVDARFGFSVAIDGDVVVVGAWQRMVSGFSRAGAVHVFRLVGGSWTEEAMLVSSTPDVGGSFGGKVDVDAETIAVGAATEAGPTGIDAGAVHVFELVGGTWSHQARIDHPVVDFRFGWSVDLDGNVLVTTAYFRNPSTFVFERDLSGNWSEQQSFQPSDAPGGLAGWRASLEGTALFVSAILHRHAGGVPAGSVYVFDCENMPPTCNAGPDVAIGCEELQLVGSADDPEGDSFSVTWSSSCAGTSFDDIESLEPVVTFAPECVGTCALTLHVDSGSDGSFDCEDVVLVTIRDASGPILSGVPPDATVECDAIPLPATVTAADACTAATLTFTESRRDGDCPGRFTLTRAWTAMDECGNATSRSQELSVIDTAPPSVTPDPSSLQVWPPRHDWRTFDRSAFAPTLGDACSLPVSWRYVACASSQPADGRGDGSTDEDCRVAADGSSFAVRAERSGSDPAGRTYTALIVATDACGNESAPAVVGTVKVPHDLRAPASRR